MRVRVRVKVANGQKIILLRQRVRVRVWFIVWFRVRVETCLGAAEREGVRGEGATPAT